MPINISLLLEVYNQYIVYYYRNELKNKLYIVGWHFPKHIDHNLLLVYELCPPINGV